MQQFDANWKDNFTVLMAQWYCNQDCRGQRYLVSSILFKLINNRTILDAYFVPLFPIKKYGRSLPIRLHE